MNERIKELAEQAEIYAGKLIDEGADYDQYPRYYTEKFSELIVQECIQQAHDVAKLRGANDDMIYGADTAAGRIAKHFGIE